MTALQKTSLVSLVVGLMLAVLVVPQVLITLRQSTALLKQQQQLQDAQPPAPTPEQTEAARVQAQQYADAQKLVVEQAARIKSELAKLAVPTKKPALKPQPHPAYSFAPPVSEPLLPIEGWNDQPKKDKPGRIHENLMYRLVPQPKAKQAGRAPCLKMVRRPAQRIQLPYGWVDVHERTIPVPCGS
jgi:hypothetical protein